MSADRVTPSNLGFAILGLLARSASTGYDLARRMENPVGYFWTARHSQIYPELRRLETSGFIEHEVIEGAGPRPTKRYALTPAGLDALRRWVTSDLETQPVRDLETLRLWSAWTVDPRSAITLIDQMEQAHAARLAVYEALVEELQTLPGSDDPAHPHFASLLTLEGGVLTRRAAVRWCRTVRRRLLAAAAPTSAASTRSG